jgi:hypothetical protein
VKGSVNDAAANTVIEASGDDDDAFPSELHAVTVSSATASHANPNRFIGGDCRADLRSLDHECAASAVSERQ